MKLSEEVLDEGRTIIRAMDLEGLMAWSEKHVPTLTAKTRGDIEKTFGLMFKARDPDRALKLFDSYFSSVDPARDVRQGLMRLGCLVFVALGLLGGIVYLVQTIF